MTFLVKDFFSTCDQICSEIDFRKYLKTKSEKVAYSILFNTLSVNPTSWSNTLKQLSAVADELFECV